MTRITKRVGRWRLLDAGPHQQLMDDYILHLKHVGLATHTVDIHCGVNAGVKLGHWAA